MSERYHTVVVPVDIKNSLFFLRTISRVMLAACDEYDDVAMPQPGVRRGFRECTAGLVRGSGNIPLECAELYVIERSLETGAWCAFVRVVCESRPAPEEA